MIEVQDLVPMPQAVRETGYNHQTLRQWARTGKIEGVNLAGKLWVFSRDDIDRLRAEQPAQLAG